MVGVRKHHYLLAAFVTWLFFITAAYFSNLEAQACSASRIIDIPIVSTGASAYMLSEEPDFTGSTWAGFAPQSGNTMTVKFMLSQSDGQKILYTRFRDRTGAESETYSTKIYLDEAESCQPPNITN